MAPFTFNFAALAILPISVLQAQTAQAQIDIIWDQADDPSTPKDRATALAALAAKMFNKLRK